MRLYSEICKEVGYDRKEQCPFEDGPVTYNAYKQGVCQNFSSREDAKKYSNLIETVIVKSADRAKWFQDRRELESKAFDIWYSELQEEYSELSVEIFCLCYNQAYDRGHAYGYDEVANYMSSIVDFAEQILAAKQK